MRRRIERTGFPMRQPLPEQGQYTDFKSSVLRCFRSYDKNQRCDLCKMKSVQHYFIMAGCWHKKCSRCERIGRAFLPGDLKPTMAFPGVYSQVIDNTQVNLNGRRYVHVDMGTMERTALQFAAVGRDTGRIHFYPYPGWAKHNPECAICRAIEEAGVPDVRGKRMHGMILDDANWRATPHRAGETFLRLDEAVDT